MKALRTLVSAISILVGAALVVAWCGAWLLLNAVDDGVVARTMARTALASPAVTASIGDEMMARTTESLAEVGVDLSVIGADDDLHAALLDWVRSPDFKQTVLDQVDAARDQVREELSREDRQAGPLIVSIDVTNTVNKQLSEVPVVGSLMPTVEVAPVPVEVASAESFSTARTVYSRLEFAQRYFLWIGLGLLAVGLAVSTRRRYVVAKFLIAVGAMALGLVLILAIATPERLVSHLPGGDQGEWGRLVVESFRNAALPGMRKTIAIIGVATVMAGALMATILRSLKAARQ